MFGGYGGGGGEAYEQAATSLSDKTGDCPKKNRGLSAGKSRPDFAALYMF